MVMVGGTLIGSRITPLSNFLTRDDLARLRLDGHVLVDDADAAFLRHGDGEARLGDGVHGGGEYGQPEAHVSRELRAKVDFFGEDVRAGRDQEDVVEGEGFFEYSHVPFYARGRRRVNRLARRPPEQAVTGQGGAI